MHGRYGSRTSEIGKLIPVKHLRRLCRQRNSPNRRRRHPYCIFLFVRLRASRNLFSWPWSINKTGPRLIEKKVWTTKKKMFQKIQYDSETTLKPENLERQHWRIGTFKGYVSDYVWTAAVGRCRYTGLTNINTVFQNKL